MTDDRFGFGQNWAEYIENYFSEERLEISRHRLLNFLKLDDLKGQVFIDIGCGSGLHSLAAYRSGAKKIISFDYDENSVRTTEYLHKYAGAPDNWKIFQGSILDVDMVNQLEKADIVYSWGVLHHTGDMWKAIENAHIPLKEDGVFFIALYTSDVYIKPTPEYWLKTKKKYNSSPALIKYLMELKYASKNLLIHLINQRKSPFRVMREYKQSRGMSYWTDIRDWLGGWPMEFAGLQETKRFCRDKLGLELINISAGAGNTEYLFRREGCKNYWDNYIKIKKIIPLEKPFVKYKGYAWIASIPEYSDSADSKEKPRKSSLMLFENNEPLGFAHAPHKHISIYGKSRYSHWENRIIFSTTDNTNPNNNGRDYCFCIDMLNS